MTPLQSWATILLLVIFVVALTYLIMSLDARLSQAISARRERRENRAADLAGSMARHPAGSAKNAEGARHTAVVTPMHQAPSLREQPGRRAHLRLVEDLPVPPKRPAPRLYDHEVDGI